MTELIKIKNTSYGRYEELLLRRDQLYREAGSILTSYIKEFGELLTAVYEEKIECIKLKKAITYCQMIINRGERVDTTEMQEYLSKTMAIYYAELEEMLRENEMAQEAKTANILDVQRAKKLYRKLAKQIHPDINPMTNDVPQLKELWNRIVIAYHLNDSKELSELEVLVNKVISECGIEIMEIEIPDIEEKIQILEDEINEILTTAPYIYYELLDDQKAVQDRKAELKTELEEYKTYRKELDEMLHRYMAEEGGIFTWTMN